MLKKLSLTNFRKHRQLTMDFTSGLNLIVGENWRGKSSALSAIPFVLFGVKATPGTSADLTTFGETDMKVELEFEASGKTYTVTRGLKSATLTCEGVKKATGNSPVTAEIEHLIGMSMRDYLDFCVTRQGEADAFLSIGSPKLADYVARVTGTDVVDTALERIKGQLQLCKGALSVLPSQERTVAEISEELNLEVGKMVEARQATYTACVAAEQAAVSSEAATKHYEALREAAEKTASTQTEREVSLGVLREAERQLAAAMAAMPEVVPEKPDRMELDQVVAALNKQRVLQPRLHALREKRDYADMQIQALSESLAVAQEEDETRVAADSEAATDFAHTCATEAEAAKRAFQDGVCPTCHRAFEGVDQAGLKAAWETAEQALLRARERAAAAHAEHMAVLDANAVVKAAQASLGAWEAYLEGLLKEIADLAKDFPPPVDVQQVNEAKLKVEAAEMAHRDYLEAQQDLARAEAWVAQARRFLDAIEVPEGPTPEDLKAAEVAAKEASDRGWEAVQARSAAMAHQSVVEALVEGLRQDLDVTEAMEQKRAHHLAREAGFTELQKFLRDNRDRFTAGFWDQLLGYASTMIQEVTSGDVTKLSRNAAGDFTYTEHGREITVEGSASGMQRAIFSTAIKLSLAAASGNPFPVMLFDEVTAAAQDSVSLQFTSLLAYAGKQVIMVTHRPADAAAADSVIEI